MRQTIISNLDSLSSGLKDLDVVILCGGEGKRLRSIINDRPKSLAPVGNKVFLDIILDNLISFGFKRIILSVGHLKEKIINYYNQYKACQILFSEEKKPLGTGGAIKKTKPFIKSDHFLAMNGDSYIPLDFVKFYDNHLKNQPLVSVALVKIEDIRDYGSVNLDNDGKIVNFNEKILIKKTGLINAGVYLMKKDIFFHMPEEESFSLEYDFFPKILNSHSCHGFISEGELIDIGTPERYDKAVKMFLE